MLLTQDRDLIQSEGLGAGNSFTIAASAKAFEVLSSNLYQNKILAVIREITCNAADAHKVAGLPLSEIGVHIPTWADPEFRVRDFGSGLSNEDVLSLYTTYFRSTKDTSNDLIGGFGLGSKSPFSVADQFTVTSWHGGAKTTYVCYKDGGLPRVNVVSSESCGTETGLSVSVAAKSSDLPWWEREARNFFCWWPELPTFTGTKGAELLSTIPKHDMLIKSASETNGIPDWYIINSNASYVLMGLVAYRLQTSAIKGLPPEVWTLFSDTGCVLNMPVGSLSISPSREALSYDNNTSAALVKKAAELAREVIDTAKQDLANQPSLYEARQYVYAGPKNSITNLMRDMAKHGKLKWRGHNIEFQSDIDTKVDMPMPYTVAEFMKRPHWKNFQRSSYTSGQVVLTHSAADEDTKVLWTDAPASSKVSRKVTHNYTDPNDPRAYHRILLFNGVPFDTLKQTLASKGWPEPIDLATLEDPPKITKGPTAKLTTQGYGVKVDHNTNNQPVLVAEDIITKDIDLTGGGVVIPFSQGTMKGTYELFFYRRALRYGLFAPAHRYLGMSHSKIKNSPALVKRMEKAGWFFLSPDYVASITPLNLLSKAMLSYTAGSLAHGGGNFDVAKLFKLHDATYGNYIPEVSAMLDVLRPYKDTMRDTYFHNSDFDDDCLRVIDPAVVKRIQADCLTLATKYRKAWDAIYAARPMLQFVNWNSQSEPAILQYLSK